MGLLARRGAVVACPAVPHEQRASACACACACYSYVHVPHMPHSTVHCTVHGPCTVHGALHGASCGAACSASSSAHVRARAGGARPCPAPPPAWPGGSARVGGGGGGCCGGGSSAAAQHQAGAPRRWECQAELRSDPSRAPICQAELWSGRVGSSCRSRHARGAAPVAPAARGAGTLADGGSTEGGRSSAALAAAQVAARVARPAAAARMHDTALPTASVPESACSP